MPPLRCSLVAVGLTSVGRVTAGAFLMDGHATALNTHVLVLNKMWMAVRVVDARRAFSLLFRDLAEVIRVDDGSYTAYDFESWADVSAVRDRFAGLDREAYDWVRTVRMHIAVPKVIRLLGYDRLPKQQVKLNRRNIFARDGNLCQYCGERFPTSELSLDHVHPRSQGGGSTWENLVCACTRCNAKKGGRTPKQARMHLIRKPERPTRNPVISLRLGHEKYASCAPSSTMPTGRSSCAESVHEVIGNPWDTYEAPRLVALSSRKRDKSRRFIWGSRTSSRFPPPVSFPLHSYNPHNPSRGGAPGVQTHPPRKVY